VPATPRTSQRLAIAGVCAVSLLICCGLAWWQWDRYSSATGTLQNLGYVLQWPLFGLFPAFMFYRIRKLRRQAEESDAAAMAELTRPERIETPVEREPVSEMAYRLPVERPAAPSGDDDDELAAYNRYLAELRSRDQ
jgi:DNA-binding transcriptional regulator of glucitol operon